MSIAKALSIRRAGSADRHGIWTVHVRAIREVCSRSYSEEQIAAWAALLSPDSYATVIKERVFLVAEDRGVVVGFGQLNQDSGEVEAVYVVPERQGEGIGHALLSSLENSAREHGVATVELSATLNAITFYEGAGYEPCGVAAHRLPTGAELPCVRMTKQVSGGGGT